MNDTPPSDEEIHSRVVAITPEIAKRLLAKNHGNRPLRRSDVEIIKREINAGRWQVTNDAIVLSDTERLLNGQHRLTAIVETGQTLKALFLTGLSDSAFEAMDRGRGRTLAEAARVEPSLASDAALIYYMVSGNQSKLSPALIASTVEFWRPTWAALSAVGCGDSRGRMNTVGLRLGVGLRWAIATSASERTMILGAVNAMLHNRTEGMPTSIATLWQRLTKGDKIGSGGRGQQTERAAQVFTHFDPTRFTVKTYVKDVSSVRSEMTEHLRNMREAFEAGTPANPYVWPVRPRQTTVPVAATPVVAAAVRRPRAQQAA